MRNKVILVAAFSALGIFGLVAATDYSQYFLHQKKAVEQTVDTQPSVEPEPQPQVEPEIHQDDAEQPDSSLGEQKGQGVNYNVPFASQAPFGLWDELHEETCEEASMVMVMSYFFDKELTPHSMEQELLKMVAWQEQQGYKVDVSAQEVVDILQAYYQISSELIIDPSVNDIIAELDKGNLVIVPASGRDLGNPNFTPPGPIYHMLVIKGYDPERYEFITNDPGTRQGHNYRYSYLTLSSAIADWNHQLATDGMTPEEIRQGSRVVISVGPQ